MSRKTLVALCSASCFFAAVSPAFAGSSPNLIVNPGAESFIGPPNGDGVFPGWTNSHVYVDDYTTFPVTWLGTPPANPGNNYFFGGVPAGAGGPVVTSIDQTIGLSASDDTAIDTGTINFDFSGYLGSDLQTLTGNDDTVVYTVTYLSATDTVLGQASIGTTEAWIKTFPTFSEYGTFFSTSGSVPVGTRSIDVNGLYTRWFGSASNGFADNLSLKIGTSVPAPSGFLAFPLLAFRLRRKR